ncbi:MAG: hypothetical protein V4510_13350 [bacterium]
MIVGIVLGWLVANVVVLVVALVASIGKPDPPPDIHELLDSQRE